MTGALFSFKNLHNKLLYGIILLPLIGSTTKKEEKEMKAKRFGSLLLTIVMVASLITALPVSASAAEVQNGTAYSANNITYSGQTRQESTGSFFVDNIGDVDYNSNYQTPKPIVMSLSRTVTSPSLSIRSTTGATGQRVSPPVSPGWTTMTSTSQMAS